MWSEIYVRDADVYTFLPTVYAILSKMKRAIKLFTRVGRNPWEVNMSIYVNIFALLSTRREMTTDYCGLISSLSLQNFVKIEHKRELRLN